MKTTDSLPAPCRYAPYRDGVYSTGPGLYPLGKDFGNGAADKKLFQIDRDFDRFHENTRGALANRRDDVLGFHEFHPEVAEEVGRFTARALAGESPQQFQIDSGTLHCKLTGTTVAIDDHPGAFMEEVQEDLAVLCPGDDGEYRVAWIHATAPNGWLPASVLGEDFAEAHAPIPRMEDTVRKGPAIMRAIASGKRYVRFVWGLTPTDALARIPGTDAARPFANNDSRAYVRVERQVLLAVSGTSAILFLMRTYIRPVEELDREERDAIAIAIRGMHPESRAYKGLTDRVLFLLGSA